MAVIFKTAYIWRPGPVLHSASFVIDRFNVQVVQDAFSSKIGIVARVYLGADLFEVFRFTTSSTDYLENFKRIKDFISAPIK